MSKHTDHFWPVDHPEIVAIALDIMMTPARRVHYSALVLELADAAIEKIKLQLEESNNSDKPPALLTPVSLQ